MTIEDIDNRKFKTIERTSKMDMKFMSWIAFNELSDMYADHGDEEGEELFQLFCNSVVEQFDETESGDVSRVLSLIEELVKKRGVK